jgi:hypothetical protein|tara:strand:+ start:321 stop:650 length:330 start_codon:yes stop_codon:yes gene_type:complete
MQSLKKPPSGGFFYFSQRNAHIHSHMKRKNQAKKKHLVVQVLFYTTQLGLIQSNRLLQIHVQLHAAQGAAVACGTATVAHATQRGGLKLVLGYFQAKKQIGVLVALFTA